MTQARKKWLRWGSLLMVPLVAVLAFVCMGAFNLFHSHEHCIKSAGLGFQAYAHEHQGSFPSNTNGFGNALLVLVKGGYCTIGEITGPGDDGRVFGEAMKTGAPIPEERCSRVYIQGLSGNDNPQIALLFDKKPTHGGDHFRRPWRPLLREVSLLDGSMQAILEKNWPAFASNQVELLVQAGIVRTAAQHYYRIP
jgi:hypothetical protein